MRRRLVLASSGFAAVAMVAAGCSGASDDGGGEGIQPIEVENDEFEPEVAPEPEIEPEPEAEPEPEVESDDPFAFDDPSEIDVDYVDRVMAELLAVDGQLLRAVLSREVSGELSDVEAAWVTALFSGPRLLAEADNYLEYASRVEIRNAFLPLDVIGSPAWETARLVHADSGCVVAIGIYDLSEVSVDPFPPEEFTAVVLESMDAEQFVKHGQLNATGWRIHEQAQLVQGEMREPLTEEDWDSLDFEAGLSLPCVDFGG